MTQFSNFKQRIRHPVPGFSPRSWNRNRYDSRSDTDKRWFLFWSLDIGIWDLPFDVAQGGESFDFAQDREPVERPVEPFVIWCLEFGILIFNW